MPRSSYIPFSLPGAEFGVNTSPGAYASPFGLNWGSGMIGAGGSSISNPVAEVAAAATGSPAPIASLSEGVTKAYSQAGGSGFLDTLGTKIGTLFGMNGPAPVLSTMPNAGGGAYSPSSMDMLTGWKDKDGTMHNGWGGLALGAGSGLMSAYMGMQQYNLFKDQLAFQKDAFNKNWEAQTKTVNAQMEDRQRARVASNAGAYQSVGDYMKQNRIA